MKAETFLKMAGVEYTAQDWAPNKAPLGKAPVLEIDGELTPDSSNIVRKLIEVHGLDIDEAVDPQRLALAGLAKRALEEHSYWGLLYLRWIDDDGWAKYRSVIGSAIDVPSFIRGPLLWFLRRNVTKDAKGQGLSRHSKADILRRVIEDLQGVEAVLGDEKFLGGAKPCSHDASAFAFIENLAHPLFENEVTAYVSQSKALREYRERMRTHAWPDWDFPAL
ncbi:MAG: glutathione S-transferase family protein [Polyangiales bacterium]